MRKLLLGLLSVSCLLFNSCGSQNQRKSINESNSNSVSINSNISTQNNKVNENKLKNSDMKEAKFGDYNYHYKTESNKTVAMFTEKFLPRDDTVVVGAIGDVIKNAFNEEATGSPTLKMHNGINKIHIDNEKNDFYVNLVKQDTGEVNSLIIEKENK
ncbi:MAG: hypothetical protein M3405_06585 [Acidobacteriota bacterium]|jgi:hypothetical protein|nr:hypothetical protein [Acidobacteriota bacterium]